MMILDREQARKAVICFLQIYYSQTKSKDAKFIIEELELGHLESKVWQDWQNILGESLACSRDNNKPYFLESIIFEEMIKFLEKFYLRTKSDDMRSFLSDLLHAQYGETADPAAWDEWQECLQKVKEDNFLQKKNKT